MSKIKKAIIPAAGLGTRFLPATKTVPKEMLTIVDAPIIFYVVEEAINAGIEDIILIAGRGKHAIEDFFDTSYELEDKLEKDNKIHLLERLNDIRSKINIISIRQKQALGLGHAILCGAPIIGNEPFAVLLGDEITVGAKGETSVLNNLVEHYDNTGISSVALMQVDDKDVSKYGIAEIEDSGGFFNITKLKEKPKPQDIKSRWAMTGRYVFDNEILKILSNAHPGLNNEIQLTDSMDILRQTKGLHGLTFKSKRYDAGDKLGFVIANIELALANEDLKDSLKDYIKKLASTL